MGCCHSQEKKKPQKLLCIFEQEEYRSSRPVSGSIFSERKAHVKAAKWKTKKEGTGRSEEIWWKKNPITEQNCFGAIPP